MKEYISLVSFLKPIKNPKNIFLTDAFGAILSTIMLGFILVRFNDFIGMPTQKLYLLASIPVVFLSYDLIVFFGTKIKKGIYLKIIAIANILYCCLSLALVFFHWNQLSNLGKTYFFLEIFIVLILVSIELRSADQMEISTLSPQLSNSVPTQ